MSGDHDQEITPIVCVLQGLSVFLSTVFFEPDEGGYSMVRLLKKVVSTRPPRSAASTQAPSALWIQARRTKPLRGGPNCAFAYYPGKKVSHTF